MAFEDMRPGQRFTRDEAYQLANKYVNSDEFAIGWDELPDTNSSWDYIEDNMTFAEIKSAARDAYRDRASDEIGDDDLLDYLMD